jgi:xylulokinase
MPGRRPHSTGVRRIRNHTISIGVDLGTSGAKAVSVDDAGVILAQASATYETARTPDGAVTQSPDEWLAATEATVRTCVARLDEPIAALGITAPAHTVVLMNRAGEPLADAMLGSDTRSGEVALELRNALGDTWLDRTLCQVTAGCSLSQLVWMRRTRPELWRHIHSVLPQKDYVRWHLTGQAATDPSDAVGTGMWYTETGKWADDALTATGLTSGQLPEVRPAKDFAGTVTPEWARRLGVRSGTPVVVGATDTAVDLVSVGANSPGASIVKVGSTGAVVAVADRAKPSQLFLTYPHAVDGMWYSVAATSAAAAAFSWFAAVLETTAPEALDQLASTAPVGSKGLLFLPFLEGERTPYWDPDLRGAFVGLSSGHTRGHLVRSILEGVALSLRSARDALQQGGHSVIRPAFTGGGLKSPLWRRICASALNTEGIRPAQHGPALGAGLLALGQDRPVDIGGETVRPEPQWLQTYDLLHPLYRATTEALESVSHTLASIARAPVPPIDEALT